MLKTLSHSILHLFLVFKELAEDGREEYRQRLAAWNALSSSQRQDSQESKTKAKKKSSKKKRAATDGSSISLPTGSRIVRHIVLILLRKLFGQQGITTTTIHSPLRKKFHHPLRVTMIYNNKLLHFRII